MIGSVRSRIEGAVDGLKERFIRVLAHWEEVSCGMARVALAEAERKRNDPYARAAWRLDNESHIFEARAARSVEEVTSARHRDCVGKAACQVALALRVEAATSRALRETAS